MVLLHDFVIFHELTVYGRRENDPVYLFFDLGWTYCTFWNAKELDLEYKNDFVSSILDRFKMSHINNASTKPTIELWTNHSVSHAA